MKLYRVSCLLMLAIFLTRRLLSLVLGFSNLYPCLTRALRPRSHTRSDYHISNLPHAHKIRSLYQISRHHQRITKKIYKNPRIQSLPLSLNRIDRHLYISSSTMVHIASIPLIKVCWLVNNHQNSRSTQINYGNRLRPTQGSRLRVIAGLSLL